MTPVVGGSCVGPSRIELSSGRDKAIREALGDMLDRVFGGSVEALLMSLVKSRQLDAGKLVKVQQLIEEHRQADREGKHERH